MLTNREEAQKALISLKAAAKDLDQFFGTTTFVSNADVDVLSELAHSAKQAVEKFYRLKLPAEDIGAANQSEWEVKRLGNALKFDPKLSGAELTKLGREKLASMSLTQEEIDRMPLVARGRPTLVHGKSID